jgi:D-arabinose 1-dehydrogenase-like Zn-dependent alcohol dehydrogenase
MLGMAVRRYGEPLESIQLAVPEQTPGQALLEVLTCGVCYSDVKVSRGRMPFSDRLSLPHVPGHEVCGRVLRADPPVIEPGTTVVANHLWPCRRCRRCRAGIEQQCTNPQGWTGFMSPGGFEERLAVPIDRLTPVPDSIDPVHAAPLTCAVGTAYRSVTTRGRVAPGARVAVIGLGGVGIHGVQIAAATGARTTGLDLADRPLEVARELGIEALRADDPESERRVLGRSGEGVDVVIDNVGSEASLQQAFRLVRPGGRIVGVGYGVDESIVLPTARFVLEEVELVGSRYVALDELERAIALVADGRVQTIVDRVLPLERANEALEALEAGDVVGRIVLDVAGVSSA